MVGMPATGATRLVPLACQPGSLRQERETVMKLLPMRGPAGPLPEFVEPGTCMYGDHPIPDGEPYVTINYHHERWDGHAADVDHAADILYACLRHAPSEEAVVRALRAAGMPV